MTTPSSHIFHIASRTDWKNALERGVYEPKSLGIEGFIHCCAESQILATANRWFRNQPDLMLLRIDPQLLRSDVRYEPPVNPAGHEPGELFPHVYGPLVLDAVLDVLDFPCDSAASFQLPHALQRRS